MKRFDPRVAAVLACMGLLFVAATTPNSTVSPQTPNIGKIQFLQGTDSAGTYKTLYVGGSNGTKITGIYLTSFDPSATHLITIQLSSSSSAHCSPATSCFGGMAITLPVSSGSANAAPAVNAMSSATWPGLPRDSDGNPYIYLPSSSYTLEMTFATALTSTDWVNGVAIGADF
jgi:hypothetical protein